MVKVLMIGDMFNQIHRKIVNQLLFHCDSEIILFLFFIHSEYLDSSSSYPDCPNINYNKQIKPTNKV